MKTFILASNSPRRIEILNRFNIKFHVVPSDYEEIITDRPPYNLVCEFAEHKALNVAEKVGDESIIVAADTIVYKDGEILGKPKSERDAYEMLAKLSGSSHLVITGICVLDNKTHAIYSDFEETIVYFKKLSDKEVKDYISTGEPFDKAGAYGIQGFGGLFVERIEGCYFNVVGLPISKLYSILGKMGVNLLTGEV